MFTKKLILVDATFTKWVNKRTKEKMESWKYIFLCDPQNTSAKKYLVGWGKEGLYKNEAHPECQTLGWKEEFAKDFNFKLKEFQGDVKETFVENPLNDTDEDPDSESVF